MCACRTASLGGGEGEREDEEDEEEEEALVQDARDIHGIASRYGKHVRPKGFHQNRGCRLSAALSGKTDIMMNFLLAQSCTDADGTLAGDSSGFSIMR